MYSLDRTIDATVEPVSLDQAKSHCRVDSDAEDDLLRLYITAARQFCEEVTGRAFLQQTWRLSRDSFPAYRQTSSVPAFLPGTPLWLQPWLTPRIRLPRPKLIEIVTVTYLDASGARQTLDPAQYTVDLDAEPASIAPAPGCYWPFTPFRSGSVQVTYSAGYGNTAAAVPATLQLAILMIVAHWYQNREATILPDSGTGVVTVPLGISEVLQAYAVDAFTFES